MAKDLKLNATKFGLAFGIVGAIITFLTTITGIYGLSNAAETMASTFWSSLGYSVTWGGSIIGLILGFVYAFLIMWISALIYNKLIK